MALWRAHFFQADPGEREWIEERGQGGSLEVELSDRRTRTANVSGASNALQTNNAFKVLTTLRGAAESNTSKGFNEYFLFKAEISTTKEVSRESVSCVESFPLNVNVKIIGMWHLFKEA